MDNEAKKQIEIEHAKKHKSLKDIKDMRRILKLATNKRSDEQLDTLASILKKVPFFKDK